MADDDGPPPEEGAPAWMATFADLSTLLLTFFVLLLSFANMDIVKFREMMGSMQDAFGYQKENFGNWNPEDMSDLPTEAVHSDSGTGGMQADLQTLLEVQTVIEKEKMDGDVEAEASPRGVVVRVKDNVMFSAGSDTLKKEGHPMLNKIVQLLGKFPCEIMIEGHTDDIAINTKKFPSNWELSSARAIAVMRYLAEIGGFAPSRLGSAGFADTRPLVPNDSTANRAQNRRVEFICVRDDEKRKADAKKANEIAKEAKKKRQAQRKAEEKDAQKEFEENFDDGTPYEPDAIETKPKKSPRKKKKRGKKKGKKRRTQ